VPRWTRGTIGWLAAVAVSLSLAAPSAAEVPAWIAAPDTEETGRPLWVSAEEAAPNGFLRWELFDPPQQEFFRGLLVANAEARAKQPPGSTEERCFSETFAIGSASEPWSPKELLSRARLVVSARIEDVTPGFLNGHLGTMMQASVREIFKEPPGGADLDEFFVFRDGAVIAIEGDYLCARGRGGFVTPKPGGIVILAMVDSHRGWPDQKILVPKDSELFFDAIDGKMSAPYAYGSQEVPTSVLEHSLRVESLQESKP
jgi:hypothetical protein